MIEQSWDLTPIYESFESDLFKNDIKKLTELVERLSEKLEKAKNSDISDILLVYIENSNTLGTLESRLSEYCLLNLSQNSDNSKAYSYLDKINDISSKTAEAESKICHALLNVKDIEKVIDSNYTLREHSYFIKELYQKSKHVLTEKEEVLYAKLRNTGSLSWEKLWENVTGNTICHIKTDTGIKDEPLSATRNMAYDSDRNIRKSAFHAEIEALEGISPQAAFALNSIKGEVINICSLRGYSSPLEMTVEASRLDKDIFNAMLEAVKSLSPYFAVYFNKKAEILGLTEKLPFYDLFAPVGENSKTYTYQQAQEIIAESFNSFSTELGNFALNAFKNNWIDVYPKKGKTGGAFCSYIHAIGQSRILTNFTGSFSDVVTIAHELGHGYHGQCLKNETYLNSDYPMPIAETASTFCESIVKNALLKTASKDEALIITESDLSDSAQTIVDILSRFLFEDEVFKLRKEGSLSARELSEIMLKAQKSAYSESLSVYHPYMWVCKPHYYDAEYNYYNFPYAFGLLLSKGLYGLYQKNGNEFVKDYNKFLNTTGKASIKDTALSIGINLSDKAFWNLSVDTIKKEIDNFCKI